MMKLNRLCAAATLTALLFASSAAFAADAVPATAPATSSSEQDDVKAISEAFGHFIGRNLKNSGINFDIDALVKGLRDGVAGKAAPMSDQDYEVKMTQLQEKALKQLSEKNLASANDYLAKNKSESGVKEIEPNKLQYMILTEGSGPVVTEHATPQIHYTGKFQDGSVFGSSEESGGPITIPLDQTIPGFSRGIAGMKEGEKRRLFVHPDLAYGTAGHLPPNSLLIFDIEVVKAVSPDKDDDADDDDQDDDLDEVTN